MALENARRSKERKPAAIEKPAPEKLAPEKPVQGKPAPEKQVAEKPRRRRVVAPKPAPAMPAASVPIVAAPVTPVLEHVVSDDVAAAVDRYIDKPVAVERDAIKHRTSKHHADEPHAVQAHAARPVNEEADDSASLAVQDQSSEADCDDARAFDEAYAEAAPADEDDMVRAEPELASVEAHQSSRISVMQRVRGWLRRAG
jgi:hypothetical protein